jgi:hypothetical protein
MKDRRPTLSLRARRLSLLLALGLLLPSCFYQEGPEDPSPIPQPTLVSVLIEYRQPNGCLNTVSDCTGSVAFFASWLPRGAYIVLTQTPDTFLWTGTATNVPVNFPPTDEPYVVRVGDPFLQDYQTAGATADRLKVGGQVLTKFLDYGTPEERGLVYIDAQGVGHNPF